ncbi:DUF202 domain-containing protein [Achromobacter mucicolens]|uniref:DUF202 domain-containing protein n=1 Tax=Achromobacter mucicolens TaxID=1389922 RepID=UPI003D70D63C
MTQDSGLQQARTHLAWGRTTLLCAALATLWARHAALAGLAAEGLVAGVAAFCCLAVGLIAHRRCRSSTTTISFRTARCLALLLAGHALSACLLFSSRIGP